MTKRRGAGKVAALLAVAVVGTVGFTAFKLFFGRTGEAAIQLLPQDAAFVVTLDTNPSERQLPTFKKIYDALEREGMGGKIDDAITDVMAKDEVGKKLRPFMGTSFAMAMLDSKKNDFVVLTAVKDPGRVEGILREGGEKVQDQPPAYKLKVSGDTVCGVIGNYFVVSNTGSNLRRIEDIRAKREQSLAESPEYLAARAGLPGDANLMIFVSPSGLAEMQKVTGVSAVADANWLAFGVTVEPEGLKLDYRGPAQGKSAALKLAGSVRPYDPEVMKNLPAGAYGAIVVSELGTYFNAAEGEMKDKGTPANLAKVQRLAKSLKGTVVAAVYPGEQGKPPAIAAYIDRTEGATFDEAIRLMREEAKGTVTSETIGEATLYTVPNGSETGYLAESPKGLAFTSSRALINQILTPSRTLADDPAFLAMQNRVMPGAQGALMFAIARTLTTEPSFEKSFGGDTQQEIGAIFGNEADGLSSSWIYDGKEGRGTMFIPMDYERAIALCAKSMVKPKAVGSTEWK